MAKFVFLDCQCGRTLRAWDHQAGATIHCWGCREPATVPLPSVLSRLPAEMWQGVRDLPGQRRLVACLAVAVVTTGALMLGRAGLVAVAVAPLVAAIVFRGPLVRGLGLGLGAVRRHPLAMLGVALVLPIGLVALEAALVGLSYQQDWLRYVALDVSPRSAAVAVLGGREDAGSIDFALLSDAEVFAVYRKGLRRGFALSWAVPASLIRGAEVRTDTGYAFANQVGWNEWVDPLKYTAYKAVSTVGAVTGVLLLLALAGQWVHRIATIEARLRAPEVPPASHIVIWDVRQATSAPESWTGISAGEGRS
jgi:hypothetical protein